MNEITLIVVKDVLKCDPELFLRFGVEFGNQKAEKFLGEDLLADLMIFGKVVAELFDQKGYSQFELL